MMSDLKAVHLPTAMKVAPIVGRTYTGPFRAAQDVWKEGQ